MQETKFQLPKMIVPVHRRSQSTAIMTYGVNNRHRFATLTLLQSLVFSSFGKKYIFASEKIVLALRNFLIIVKNNITLRYGKIILSSDFSCFVKLIFLLNSVPFRASE